MGEVRSATGTRPDHDTDPDEAVVDPVELLEIDLLSELIIAASDSPLRLSTKQIDDILGIGRTT